MKLAFLNRDELNIPAATALVTSHYRLGVVLLLLGYTVLQISLFPRLLLTYDEGINLQVSRLIGQGYEPYRQIFTLANPLFVWFIGGLAKLGLSLGGFRFVFLLFGLLLLASTAGFTRFLLGSKAALATLFLLATAVTFLAEATAALAVIPALSIATFALLLLSRYLITKKIFWLFASGAGWSIALGFSTSVFSLSLVTVLCLLFAHLQIAEDHSITLNWRASLKTSLIWLVGSLLPLLIGLLLANPELILNHHLKNQAIIRQNLPLVQADNFRLIGYFLVFNIFLSLFAVYGLVQIYDQFNHPLWLIFMWGLLSFGWLMFQIAPQRGDTAILLPPLAILAGWGAANLGQRLVDSGRRWLAGSTQRWLLPGLGILCLSAYIFISWQQLNGFIFRDIDTEGDLIQFEQRPEMIAFIRQETNPDDCVIIDDPTLAIQADRLPPPQLVGLSRERVAGGLISQAEVQRLVEEAGCKLALFYRRDYHRHLLGFRDWAEKYYSHEEQQFRNTKIFF